MKHALLPWTLALLVVLSGCMFSRAAGRSMGQLFETPEKVKKVDQPVRKDARLAILWVGHATALVQMDDKFILTDPVFTNTVGMLSKRKFEPGLDVEKLPKIDAVLVSHMHMDHLSLGTLELIEDKTKTLFVPQGGTSYITDFGFPIIELRRWQNWEKDGLRITAVAVQHMGGRYGLDANWNESFTGYVIEYHGMKVWFGGDTAYDQKAFVETGERFPNLDLAIMPIGPIEPRDFMRHFHVDPREAMQAFLDLGAKRMVPVHYGTFINSTDEPGDALKGLQVAKEEWRLGDRQVLPLAIGEQRVLIPKK